MTPVSEFKLPLAHVLAANNEIFTVAALDTARLRAESLPVDALLKLTSSQNEKIKRLAIENLGRSAAVADIPRIESVKGRDE